MARYYVIAIGGTGTRCLEALIHLCAAGMGPDEMIFLVVDSDESQGNIETLKRVIDDYESCQRLVSSSQSIFRTRLTYQAGKIVWSPARRGETLSDYFKYNTLISSSKELGGICNLLYSQEELGLVWDYGFCGRAIIGSPVMARIKESLDKEPWSNLIQNIEHDLGTGSDVRVFVFASVFGAAGASGFPVIADIIRHRFQKEERLNLGGALILPYFSFHIPADQTGVFSSPKDFLLKSKVALGHYSESWKRKRSPYNSIYLIDEKTLDLREDGEDRKFALGGPKQDNYAHYIELLAALSCLGFYRGPKNGILLKEKALEENAIARRREKVIGWEDLYSDDLKRALLPFLSLAFAYRGFYYPLLTQFDLARRPSIASWYVDNFLKNGLSFEGENENLETVNRYFQTFFEWIYEICFSTDINLEFISKNALKISKRTNFELSDNDFGKLSPSDKCICTFPYDSLWDNLCDLDLSASGGSFTPTEKLLYMLHMASEKFCTRNYEKLTEEAKQTEALVLYLPDHSGEVASPNKPGTFEPIEGLAKKLSKGIKVPKDASMDALTAVPTVWARPILFAEALLNGDHPLHNQILEEWRGLLGLFCFKNAYGWRMESVSHRIKEDSHWQFERILHTLRPSDVGDDWLKIHLIYVDNVLIGCTSPLSLYFTPAEYKCPDSVPWRKKDGRLGDPTTYLSPQKWELSVLKQWIEEAIVRISGFQCEDQDMKEKLLEALRGWFNEIKEPVPAGEITVGGSIVHEDPYQLLSFVSSYTQPKFSDFFLDCRLKEKPPIICVKELWERDGIVYPPIKASNIPFEHIPQRLEIRPKDILESIEYDGMVLRPEYLFTDRILKLSLIEKNVITNHKDYLFPLRKKILTFFDPERLAELISWQEVKGEGVKVSLRLPLKTNSGSEKIVEVSRFYANNQIKEINVGATRALELWPDFDGEGWPYYYGLYERYDDAEKSFSCEPYPDPNEVAVREDTLLWKMRQFPRAMIFKDSSGNPIGLAGIRKGMRLPEPSLKWAVSVDFGTSNTCVCVRMTQDTPPNELVFKDRCIQLSVVDEIVRKVASFSSFFPASDTGSVFPSHLRVFQPSSNPDPLLDGLILFVEPSRWARILRDVEVHENLKWSVDQSERSHIATFLKQVLLMITAEARIDGVKYIDLYYSYPSAFSKDMKKDLEGFWNAIIGIGESSGVSIKLFPPETESVAICKYFIREWEMTTGAKERPQVVVDIGGGTSDVAIWMKNKLQLQTSLLLAGNEVSKYAGKEPRFRRKLGEILKPVSIDEKAFGDHPSAIMNILFQLYETKLSESINTTQKHTPEIRRARTIIFLMASGIFYYIGLLLRYIASKLDTTINGCDVYLAGNGSKLLHWCLGDDHEPIADILKAAAGSLSLKDIRFPSTAEPRSHVKQEVARGLLHDYQNLESIEVPVMITGEQGYKSDGNELSWDFDMRGNFGQLKTLSVPDGFSELKNFVEAFNIQAANLHLEELNTPLTRVKARIEHILEELKQGEEKALIQPLFIEEVKALLTELRMQPL